MRTDIYFCPCCNSFRDNDHKRISNKYCMGCDKIGKQKTKKIRQGDMYGQFCPDCYKEVMEELE